MINIKDEKSARLSRARSLKVVENNCACASHGRICGGGSGGGGGGGDMAPFTLSDGATWSWVLSLGPSPLVTRKNSVTPA